MEINTSLDGMPFARKHHRELLPLLKKTQCWENSGHPNSVSLFNSQRTNPRKNPKRNQKSKTKIQRNILDFSFFNLTRAAEFFPVLIEGAHVWKITFRLGLLFFGYSDSTACGDQSSDNKFNRREKYGKCLRVGQFKVLD
jgi:hypothetical protein